MQMRVALAVGLGCVTVGCVSLLGDFEVLSEAAGTEGEPMGPDGQAALDAAPPDVDAGVEPILPCDENERPTVADGVFASTDGDDSAGNGTPLLPFRTINRSITAAVAGSKKRIYVAEGTYAESLAFDGARQGFVVSGAWKRAGDAWSRDCSQGFRTRTVVASPSNIAVRVSGVTTTTGLDALTVATKGTCAAGESCFGIFVSGANTVFSLKRVRVVAGSGGSGLAPRSPAPSGNRVCNGTSDCSNGAAGGTADAGNPGGPGSFTEAGFVPGDGLGGGTGTVGAHGTPGGPGNPTTCANAGVGQCNFGGDQCIHGASSGPRTAPGRCGCGGLGGGGCGGGGGESKCELLL